MAELGGIRAELSAVAERFDADGLLTSEAEAVVAEATAIVNAASTIRMLAAKRVAESAAWRHRGYRSAADWLAGQTKSSFAEARAALGAAEKLGSCPKVASKAREGKLTPAQTEALTDAVSVDPSVEDRLLGTAERDGLGKLKDQCRAVALSRDDVEARATRIHRERSLTHWTDAEGAFRLAGKLTPEAGAIVLGALAPFEKAVFEEARREGRHERHEAYLADALTGLAAFSLAGASGLDETQRDSTQTDGTGKKPKSRKPSFTVLVDIEALLRGHVEAGETCEIPGVGPIPVRPPGEQAPPRPRPRGGSSSALTQTSEGTPKRVW